MLVCAGSGGGGGRGEGGGATGEKYETLHDGNLTSILSGYNIQKQVCSQD